MSAPDPALSRRGRRTARFVLPLAAIGALAAAMPPAWGHAALIASDPQDGEVLAAAPDRVRLTFSEDARPVAGRLTSPDNRTILLESGQADGSDVVFALPDVTSEGSYLLSWRITSSDGHPVAGATIFSLGRATDVSSAGIAAPVSTKLVLWGARAILFAGLLFGVGGAAFLSGLGRSAPALTRHAITWGLWAVPVVAVFQALDILGAGAGALATPAPWRETLRGPPALALLAAALSLFVARLAVARRPHAHPLAGVAAIALAGGAAAMTGHAATAAPQMLMRPAVLLHVVAAAAWLGAFAPLVAGLARRHDEAALRRFEAIIPWMLLLLVATGVALSVVQLDRVEALWMTAYGRVLMAKLVVVAALLSLGALNRFRLTAAARDGAPRPLARSIRSEIALAAAIIGILGLWRFTPPPRSIPAAPVELVQPLSGNGVSAQLRLSSNRAGPVDVSLSEFRLDGRSFTPREATVEFSKPAFGLGPFARTVPVASPVLDAGRFILPMDGFWVLRLKILVDDFRSEDIIDIVTLEPTAQRRVSR